MANETTRPAQSDAASANLTPQAERALAEAQARRAAHSETVTVPREVNGREGPEPIRFGDWENKGIATDF